MKMMKTVSALVAWCAATSLDASVFYGTKGGSGTTVTDMITWYADEACTSTAGVVPPTAAGASEHTYVILGAGKWQKTSSFPDVTTYIGTDGVTVGSSVAEAFRFNMNCGLVFTFPHVTVFSGIFMGNSDATTSPVAFAGDYTFVKTTQPIEFHAENVVVTAARGCQLAGTFRSEADVTIAFKTTSACHDETKDIRGLFRISGDLSAFKGSFDVTTPTYTQSAKGGLASILELTSATAFGDVSSPRHDAFTLHDKVHLKIGANVVQSTARAITLALGTSEQAYLTAEDTENWTLTAPLYGASGTLVKEGSGTVTLDGPAEIGTIVVTAGTLTLGSKFAFKPGCTVTVKPGAKLVSSLPQGLNVVLEDGAAFALAPIPYDPATDKTEPPTLVPGQTWTGRLLLSLAQVIPLPFVAEKRLPVLKVPQSVKTLTADDLPLASSRDAGLPVTRFEVETDGSGLQTVYLVARPVLYSTDTNKTEDNMRVLTNTTLWTDGLAAHGGADYVVNNGAFLATAAEKSDAHVVFPGASLELSGGSRLHLRTQDTTVSNLVVAGGSRLTARGWADGEKPHRVHGRVSVVQGTSSQVDFLGWSSPTSWVGLDLHAELGGTARLQFSGSPRCDFIVSSTNASYMGKFGVGVGGNQDVAIRFAHPLSLGGPLASYAYDAVGMYSVSNGLKPTTSMTYDVANRGLYLLESKNFICTPEHVDFIFRNPIRTANGFRKTGPGSLALGGRLEFGSNGNAAPNGTNNRLKVEAGYLKAVATNSYEQLALTFADGAGIAVDAAPADADVAAYGLCSSTSGRLTAEGRIAVRLDGAQDALAQGRPVSVVVCTVAADVPDLTPVLKGVKPAAQYAGHATRETLPDGRVRYSMTFERTGLAILLR